VLAAPTPAPNSSGGGSGLTGWILYRIYAPYAGTPGAAGTAQEEQFIQGGVNLPTIATLPSCRSRSAEPFLTALSVAPINKIVQQAATPAPEPLFQYNNGGSLFPNDDNKYVYATTTWASGRLIIVTAAAATFPNTDAQPIVQVPAPNVRYWSMCTNKDFAPAPVVLCADDQKTKLFTPSPGSMIPAVASLFPGASATPAPSGSAQYAYVISSTADRPANLDPNFTWLPWFDAADEPPSLGSQIPGILILRNMLPVPSFIHSVQNIPTYGQSAAQALLASLNPPQNPNLASNSIVQAIAVMGPYYPAAVYCDTTVFTNAYATTKNVGATIAACVKASATVSNGL
jgi:hypothetical protein